MLHTSITEAVGDLPIESVSLKRLPKADYYAFAHLHINFEQKVNDKPAVYSGPIFPNSFQELEDLCYGRFYIVQVEGFVEQKKILLPLKEVVSINIQIDNTLTATQKIINEFEKHNLNDKIVLLRLYGSISQGTNADIDFKRITDYLEQKRVFSFLKNTNKLQSKEGDVEIKITTGDMNKIEEALIKQYESDNPDKFNDLITPLMHGLDLQKQDDEKTTIYETRLLGDLNKILGLDLK